MSILKNLDQEIKILSRQLKKSPQVSKVGLDQSRHLDLDLGWFRLSIPPSLVAFLLRVAKYFVSVAKICVFPITLDKFFVICCIVGSQNFKNS